MKRFGLQLLLYTALIFALFGLLPSLQADYTTNPFGLLVRNVNGNLLLYPFNPDASDGFYDTIAVGHSFSNQFVDYFVGEFTGDGRSDLVVRRSDGDLILYPMSAAIGNGFYGSGPHKIGNGFRDQFTLYLVGDFTGDRRSDFLVRTTDGNLLLYPMASAVQQGLSNGPITVGKSFNDQFTHYFVVNVNDDLRNDLIVRTKTGDLLLYTMEQSTETGFHFAGDPIKVGNGFGDQYTHYFFANFSGYPFGDRSDLMARTTDGELRLWILNIDYTQGYYGNDYIKVGNGFGNQFTHYMVGDFYNKTVMLEGGFQFTSPRADLLVRTENGDLLLYPFSPNEDVSEGFYGGGGPFTVGTGFSNLFTHYLIGKWQQDG